MDGGSQPFKASECRKSIDLNGRGDCPRRPAGGETLSPATWFPVGLVCVFKFPGRVRGPLEGLEGLRWGGAWWVGKKV